MNAVDLITMIDRVPQTVTAGKPISAVLNERNPAKKPVLPTDVVALLAEVTAAQDERHALAHGLWTVPSTVRLRMAASFVERKSVASHSPTVGDTMTIDTCTCMSAGSWTCPLA